MPTDALKLSFNAPTLAPSRPSPVCADGDHERMAHIVLEGFRMDDDHYLPTGPSVIEGIVEGTPVTALCGKVWVPGRDPRRYPLCPTCKEIASAKGWALPVG